MALTNNMYSSTLSPGMSRLPEASRLPESALYNHRSDVSSPRLDHTTTRSFIPAQVTGHKRSYVASDDDATPAKLPYPPPPVSLRLPSSHECAIRSYEQMKTGAGFDYGSKMPEQKYGKPPSPSGSLSSLDSEPLSPSASTTSETSKCDAECSKYPCQVCRKSYSHPRLLNRHLQTHTPYKKHHCHRCGKGFNDAFDLKRHVRTHTGIKPFQCSLCEKSFTQRCSLEAHLTRVHSVTHKFAFRERRPKLFVCEVCGTTFQDNTEFRQHDKEGKCVPQPAGVHQPVAAQ